MHQNVRQWMLQGHCQAGLPPRLLMLLGNSDLFDERPVRDLFDSVEHRGVFRVGGHRPKVGRRGGQLVAYTTSLFGAPKVAMYLEVARAAGVQAVIAAGYVGSFVEDVPIGSLFVPTAAIADDGTTRAYGLGSGPFAADPDLTQAVLDAAKASDVPCRDRHRRQHRRHYAGGRGDARSIPATRGLGDRHGDRLPVCPGPAPRPARGGRSHRQRQRGRPRHRPGRQTRPEHRHPVAGGHGGAPYKETFAEGSGVRKGRRKRRKGEGEKEDVRFARWTIGPRIPLGLFSLFSSFPLFPFLHPTAVKRLRFRRSVMNARRFALSLFLLPWLVSPAAAEEPLFPFVVSYDCPQNATNVSAWLQRPAGKHGFVRAESGHLATDAGPIRFWATNLCFEACFPDAPAGRAARRPAGPAGHQLRAHAPHGQSLDLGQQPQQAHHRPQEARPARLPHLPAQAARRLRRT